MRIFFVLCVVGFCLGFSPTAHGQTYQPVTIGTVPATLASATATNSGTWIDLRQNSNVALALKCAGANNSTDTVSAVFLWSPDTVTTSTPFVLTVALANTGTVCASTNLSAGAFGWLKLAYVTNSTAVTITNLSVLYGLKPGN